MVDLDCSMKENKVRKFIVKNHDRLQELMFVKQADFRASLEEHSACPTLIKWQRIYDKMRSDGTPFTLKDLKITAKELIAMGFSGAEVGKELKKLHDFCVLNPQRNNHLDLEKIAKKDLECVK